MTAAAAPVIPDDRRAAFDAADLRAELAAEAPRLRAMGLACPAETWVVVEIRGDAAVVLAGMMAEPRRSGLSAGAALALIEQSRRHLRDAWRVLFCCALLVGWQVAVLLRAVLA